MKQFNVIIYNSKTGEIFNYTSITDAYYSYRDQIHHDNWRGLTYENFEKQLLTGSQRTETLRDNIENRSLKSHFVSAILVYNTLQDMMDLVELKMRQK